MNINLQECPRCEKRRRLSDAGGRFTEPLCAPCRREVEAEPQFTAFDEAYERARVNGWAD